MNSHSLPDSPSTFSRQLPFPFNIASRIWRRLWHGILLSCQKASPSSGARIPLTPSPTQFNEEKRGSPPNYRPVPYDGVSYLMDVDYLRGNINRDGISQDGHMDSLRVVNPDIRTPRASTISYYDMFDDIDDRVGRRSSHVPCLPDFWFTQAPTPPLSISIGLGLQQLGESMMPGNQVFVHAESCPAPATESMPEELSFPSNPNERPFPTRPQGLPRGGFSRAMGFFMTQSSLRLSEADMIQDCSLEDDDSDINTAPSPRSGLPSFDSNIGSSTSFAQYRSQWLRNCQSSQTNTWPVTPDIPEPEVMMPNQHQPSGVSASGNSGGARSRGRSRRVSSNCSNSSSTTLSVISEGSRYQQRGIFGSLLNLPYVSLTLAAGMAAQRRRFG